MTLRSLRPVVFLACLAAATAVIAQEPASQPSAPPPAGQQQRRPMPPPSNLKVLPKDMTAQQVVAIMRRWEGELGVECEYCHAKDPATGRNNFASDANPVKDKARLMLTMNMEINTKFVSTLTPKPENEVTCGTCHRGVARPTVFVPKPQERGPRPATPPAPSTPPAQQ